MTVACQGKNQNASLLLRNLSTYLAPHRGGRSLRVARRQQQLCLVGFQPPGGLVSARPPHELPLRKPLLGQPEPLAVVNQDADRRAAPAAKHKQAAGKGVRLKFLLTQTGERVDALPFLCCSTKKEICAVHCYVESIAGDRRMRPCGGAGRRI